MIRTPPSETVEKMSKILVVDDDSATRERLAILLAGAGYKAVTVGNVPSAMQAMTDADPDLLITDVRVGMQNGLHVLAMAPKSIPTVVVMEHTDSTLEAEARRLGADYVVKPISPEALLSLIARMLEEAKGQGAANSARRAAPRRRLVIPVAIRVVDKPGRVLDVSERGVGFEVGVSRDGALPPDVVLNFVSIGQSVTAKLVWTLERDESTWICGASITDDALPRWRALLQTLS
ncbi:MAG: hypothetical protein A3F70_09955 [Acidobacteria bacterium RIFCSPLOWO2_12_FULL_67_14]|nr:MAG: hypothetical protein A3F70_09955 [Acidobacteria bacterium RIFCSPLOWO2_12_FULL_67_14]